MATNSFVRVPPDSTGKKLHAQEHTVDGGPVLIPVHHVGCGSHPEHLQQVDARGQASVRFAEGSPSMDAFGNLRVGEGVCIGSYEYSHGDSADLFQDEVANGGTITHVPAKAATELAVTSATGSKAVRTTVRYHHYQPGVSNLVIQTLQMSPGIVNNRRRYGYFDTQDGLFWEIDGTQVYVVNRSSVSGVVVDTRIAPANWNTDKIDGTGVSGMTLDTTKANFYFIDYAWLGVGEVRFGILGPGGERNVCHVFRNPNANTDVYMRSGCMPLRWENENYGVVGGPSTLKAICAAVYSQSRVDYTFWRFSDIERDTPVTVTSATPVLSMRVGPGSHVGVYPEQLSVYVAGGNVKLQIVDDAVLTGATWGITGGGVAQGDVGATAASGGDLFKTFYVGAGVTNIDLSPFYELTDEGYHRFPDDTGSYTFTLLATKLDGTTVTAVATLGYKELR